MGLTAHNKQRREMAAQGRTGAVTRAQAQYDAAAKKAADLTAALAEAKTHLAGMESNLKAAETAAFEALPKTMQRKLRADAVKQLRAEKAAAKKARAAAKANEESQAEAKNARKEAEEKAAAEDLKTDPKGE